MYVRMYVSLYVRLAPQSSAEVAPQSREHIPDIRKDQGVPLHNELLHPRAPGQVLTRFAVCLCVRRARATSQIWERVGKIAGSKTLDALSIGNLRIRRVHQSGVRGRR